MNRKGKDLTSEDIHEQGNQKIKLMRQRLKKMARQRIAVMSNQELKDFLFPKNDDQSDEIVKGACNLMKWVDAGENHHSKS